MPTLLKGSHVVTVLEPWHADQIPSDPEFRDQGPGRTITVAAGGLRPAHAGDPRRDVLNAAFAYVQEQQAERAVEALAAHLPARATVPRDGHRRGCGFEGGRLRGAIRLQTWPYGRFFTMWMPVTPTARALDQLT